MLSKHFPLPKFLELQHIGISFSDANIKAVFFDKNVKNPELKTLIVPLEKGSIVSGVIVDAGEVAAKLKTVKESFDLPEVFFTIPDELAYVFRASVAADKGGNIAESVAFIIEENVPLTLTETVFDYSPIKAYRTESECKADVVVAAAVKKEVERFVSVLRESGLNTVGCANESQAIAEALLPAGVSGTDCIVHARNDRVGIYLAKDRLVFFSTLRNVSSEDYKNQFLDEYEKFLEYRSKYDPEKEQPMGSVLICGEFEWAKKAAEALIDSPHYAPNVKLSNVWANVFDIDKHLPEIPYEKSLSLAGPIGAVLSEIL